MSLLGDFFTLITLLKFLHVYENVLSSSHFRSFVCVNVWSSFGVYSHMCNTLQTCVDTNAIITLFCVIVVSYASSSIFIITVFYSPLEWWRCRWGSCSVHATIFISAWKLHYVSPVHQWWITPGRLLYLCMKIPLHQSRPSIETGLSSALSITLIKFFVSFGHETIKSSSYHKIFSELNRSYFCVCKYINKQLNAISPENSLQWNVILEVKFKGNLQLCPR